MTQNLSVSQNNQPSPVTLELVTTSSKKAKENQTAELIQLSALLQEMEVSLGSVSSKTTSTEKSSANASTQNSTPAPASDGSYRGNLGDALAQAAYYLELIEALVAGKYNQASTNADNTVMQAYNALNTKTIADEATQCKQIQEAQEEQAHESFWQKVFSVIATIVVTALAVLCGQPEIAALTVFMFTMNESGATSKIVGNSIYATIGVLAVTSLLSFGAGSAVTVEAEVEEAAQSLLARVAKLITPSLRAGLVIQNDVQVLLSTQGLQNIINEIPVSTDEKEKLTKILTYILSAIAVLSSLSMGSSMVNVADEAGAEATGFLGKMRNLLKNAIKNVDLNNPKILAAMGKLQKLSLGTVSGLQIAQGVNEIQQGKMEQALGADQAMLGMVQALMSMLADMVQNSQTQTSTLLNGHQTSTQSISTWLNAERAFAQMFGSR